MRLITLLLFAALFLDQAFAQTNNSIITLIPTTNPATGVQDDTGILRFRDMAGKVAGLRAPLALDDDYELRLPEENLTGCLKNTASGAYGQLSFEPCPTIDPMLSGVVKTSGGVLDIVSGGALQCVRVDATAGNCILNPMTTSGDTIYGGSFGLPTRLAIGTTGQVLKVDSGLPTWSEVFDTSLTGVIKATSGVPSIVSGGALQCVRVDATAGNCILNPLTTSGDLLYGGSFGLPSRLALGSNGQILTVASGALSWATSIPSLTLTSSLTVGSLSGVASFTSGAVGIVSGGALQCVRVDATAGNCILNPLTTSGDLLYGGSFGTPSRLGIGSNGQYLSVSGGALAWGTISGSTPLSFSGGTMSIAQATSSTNGYLSSTDWNTFNGKLADVMTTTGDLTYRGSLGSTQRLAIGGTGQVLGTFGGAAPQWQTITGTSPISFSGYTVSCSSCVTTAGGQSIAGTTTLSTASISSALAGTFNMSGNMTITGNAYIRTYSGADANCTGVSNGWFGYRTDANTGKGQLQICNGGGSTPQKFDPL